VSSTADPSKFIEVLSPAMRQAASIARALEGRVQNTPKKEESTEVKQALTIADTATQEALLVPLREPFPQGALEAADATETARSFAARGSRNALVVIDPIDGTLHSYLRGEGPYAVMAGLAIDGRYEAALVALPREGLFFEAVRGGGARMAKAGSAMRAVRVDSAGERVFFSHGIPEASREGLRRCDASPVAACGGAVSIAPLVKGVRAGIRWGHAEEGISIRGRIGLLVAREAGLCVLGSTGQDFPEDIGSFEPGLVIAPTREAAEPLLDCLPR